MYNGIINQPAFLQIHFQLLAGRALFLYFNLREIRVESFFLKDRNLTSMRVRDEKYAGKEFRPS